MLNKLQNRKCNRSRFVIIMLTAYILAACNTNNQTHLQKIKAKGELRIVTRQGPTTYFIGGNGPSGFEYDLAARFAEFLGVSLSVISSDDLDGIMSTVNAGKADLAAAGLTITPEREKLYHFSPPYQNIDVKLVFKQGKYWPRNFDQLDGKLTVLAQSSHAELLLQQKKHYAMLSWHESNQLAVEDLVESIVDDSLSYTLIDSNDLSLQRRYHPELAIAFTVAKDQQLAWAFSRKDDDSLYQAAAEFFSFMQKSGDLAQLQEIYYGHLKTFDYVGSTRFLQAAQTRLPQFIPFFKSSAKQNLDWKLLAAIAYQESHWNPKAKSPTGVRGMMMLTLPTAKHLGIKSRLDPKQSIEGGARYFEQILKKIPKRIKEPDFTWMALAAYNVGFGHLEDARILTQFQGGNPDKWIDVKERLPLLRQRKWYKFTRHGYARGDEPVQYVDNVRRYYEVLKWLYDDDEKPGDNPLEEINPEQQVN